MSAYQRAEVATLRPGVTFIDRNDIPHVVQGFTFWPDNPGIVTVITDQLPFGMVMDTTALVWVES
jgi:hypothetical protein